jgi:hypothetical protein
VSQAVAERPLLHIPAGPLLLPLLIRGQAISNRAEAHRAKRTARALIGVELLITFVAYTTKKSDELE